MGAKFLALQYVSKCFISLIFAGILPIASLSFVLRPGFDGGFCRGSDSTSFHDQVVISNASRLCEAFTFCRRIRKHANSNSLYERALYRCKRYGHGANRLSTISLSSLLLTSSTEKSNSATSENAIPPIDPDNQSKFEQEFYSMMLPFADYTPRDIASVSNYRFRALFEGVAAGATEPQVIRAFAIIFEDLLPVRIGGRMIFKRLKQIMESSIERRDSVDEKLKNVTGFTTDEIDKGRKAFSIMDVNGEGELTIGQLIDSGIVETVAELCDCKSFDDFVEKLKKDDEGRLDFETFMIGLQRCEDDGCHYNCNYDGIFLKIVKMMEPIEEQKKRSTFSERKKKASAQYDMMVAAFSEWEDLIPDGDGRMIEVLRGCFAGAKNEKVLNALKIVYTDYSTIRIAGDIIFKLMRRLVTNRKQK